MAVCNMRYAKQEMLTKKNEERFPFFMKWVRFNVCALIRNATVHRYLSSYCFQLRAISHMNKFFSRR